MKNIINNIFSPNLSSKSETDKLFADWKQWDFEYLLEHFDVKNIATERGLANIPASSATTQDEFHANLESRYRIIIADRTADINNRIESLESRSERAHEKIDFLNDEKVNLQDKLEQDYEAYKPEITLLNSRVKSAKDELNKFKKQNKLTRDADYPETLWWHYFVLISLVVIESVINASFFAEGSRAGLAGGLFIAVMVSGINVVLGYLVGKYWGKLTWSINKIFKTIGIVGFSTWVFITACFNLTVGHVRESYTGGEFSEAMTSGFQAFKLDWFGIEDFSSWMLVLIGSLFAIVALIDGLKSDDRYPFFGALDRKLRDLQLDQHSLIDELKNMATDETKDYLKEGDRVRKDLNKEAISLRESHDFVKAKVALYPDYCKHYEKCFIDLINTYRNYNMEARIDPPPKYFHDTPSFDWDTNNRDEQLSMLSKKIDDIRDQAERELEQWTENRKDFENIKKEFLERMREDDSIS